MYCYFGVIPLTLEWADFTLLPLNFWIKGFHCDWTYIEFHTFLDLSCRRKEYIKVHILFVKFFLNIISETRSCRLEHPLAHEISSQSSANSAHDRLFINYWFAVSHTRNTGAGIQLNDTCTPLIGCMLFMLWNNRTLYLHHAIIPSMLLN